MAAARTRKPVPLILALCCNWCAYAAADLAGSARLECPPGLRIIRVMCSGMVHPDLIREAFGRGVDGVMVFGCPIGQCHYQDGNLKAMARQAVVEETLQALGLEAERFHMARCSSAEAEVFVKSVREMSARMARLGPSPLRDGPPGPAEELL